MKKIVYLPVSNLSDPFFRHTGDTFRELVQLWEEAGFVDIIWTNNNYVWIGEEDSSNGVVLYDRPTLEWWNRDTPKQYKCVLFGNPNANETQIERAYPWIFWGRRPRMLEKMVHEKQPKVWTDRNIKIIFMGKIENNVQQVYRDATKWRSVCECEDDFCLVVGQQTKYPYSQTEYLNRLANARYGLCLRGYGPKCNREIELMALGTVPIVARDVDMTNYFDPPQRGLHYLIAENPDDAIAQMAAISPSTWEQMSSACRDWYMRNCSIRGSFYQTLRIIQTISTTKLINTPMINAWSVPDQKLPNTYRVVIDTVFFERTFSGISRVWLGLLNALKEYRAGNIEFVLLVRAKSLPNLSAHYLQCFSFVGIPTFTYHADLEEDVKMLNSVCATLQADLFISTYYTYTTSTPTLAIVHDMIPEHFGMAKNQMWIQKDKCLANAQWFMCVSEFAKKELIQFSTPPPNLSSIFVVPNSFDPYIFHGVDDELVNSAACRNALRAELQVELPFVLVCASNSEPYKNLRLVTDMIKMNPPFFAANLCVVFLTNNEISLPSPLHANIRSLKSVTDRQLGLLYGLASALIYPSRCEGFGLPVLEAFWSECPIICSKSSGGIEEIGRTGCFYVSPDNPNELFQLLKDIIGGKRHDEIREKAAFGLRQLEKYTLARQITKFMDCINLIASADPTKKYLKVEPQEYNKPKNNMQAIPTTAPTTAPATTAPTAPTAPTEIHVIIQYFTDSSNADRQNEYDFCVQANLANPSVAKVHCLLENQTGVVPDWLRSNPKYVETRIPSRLTYKQAFDYANTNLVGKVCALMNLDIFLDHNNDWKAINALFDMSVVFCLSRHEFDGVGASTKDPQLQNIAYANAQDCWLFKSPIFVKDCDFKLGMLGCDNAIAHRIKSSGYIPINSPNEFKIHHFDVCRGKQGANFLAHHLPNPEQPDERGYYLLPDYSALERVQMIRKVKDGDKERDEQMAVISVDSLIDKMGLGQIHRYRIVCDIMSSYIKLGNPTKK